MLADSLRFQKPTNAKPETVTGILFFPTYRRQTMKPFLLVVSILSFVTGGLFVVASCEYTSDGGPFNFDFHYYSAFIGLGIVVVGYVCLLRSAISRKIKGAILLSFGLLIFAGGRIFMAASRAEVQEFCWGESGPEPPMWICLLVYYTTAVGLSLHGLILAARKNKTHA